MDVSKEQAIIEYLLGLDNYRRDSEHGDFTPNNGCDSVKNNRLFFNFLVASDSNKQFVTMANDKVLNRNYVDGSVMKRYSFTIIDFRSVNYQPLVKDVSIFPKSENIEEYLDIQGIIDWITEQNDVRNYPIFGSKCIIDTIRTTTESPNLNGVDTNAQPVLAKYSMTIQIDYLDTTKRVWN